MGRLIVGNLDCEIELARSAYRRATHPDISNTVAKVISAAALRLTAFAKPNDTLWTPRPIPADALGRVPGAEDLNLVSGSLEKLIESPPSASAILAWGETETIAKLRGVAVAPVEDSDPVELGTNASSAADRAKANPPRPPQDWTKLLWSVHPSTRVARDCNHRGFAYAFARRRGLALPGAALLQSSAAVDAHIAGGGAASSRSQSWVLKAPFSAAGRERIRHKGPLEGEVKVHANRLFERYRLLLFEPWMERLADFGAAGFIDKNGSVSVFQPHRLETDSSGVFRAIIIADSDWPIHMSDDEHDSAVATAAAVGEALSEVGFRGPFSVDSYAYRDRKGRRRFHPLCEINARLTFGHVARAWSERLNQPHYELRLD